jgi:hypothetical protein
MFNTKQKVQGKIYEASFLYRKSDYVQSGDGCLNITIAFGEMQG